MTTMKVSAIRHQWTISYVSESAGDLCYEVGEAQINELENMCCVGYK